MTSSAVTKKPAAQDVPQSSRQGVVEEQQEHSSKASANAGLNLNIFGALSGALSSKSKKETAENGSSVEEKEQRAQVKGAGAGNLNAQAAASAEEKGRQMRRAVMEGRE